MRNNKEIDTLVEEVHSLALTVDTLRSEGWVFVPAPISSKMRLSAYTSSFEECDEDPWTTAFGTGVRPRTLALSQDMVRSHTPGAPFRHGDILFLATRTTIGAFRVEDVMNERWTNAGDIWMEDQKDARTFGVRHAKVWLMTNRGD